jgi:hypothetical protein
MPDTQGRAPVPDEARTAGWDAYMEAVHANRDHPQRYASTVDVAAPLIVAAELERLAEPLRAQIARQHDRIVRLSKADVPLWQSESAIAAEQELKGFVGMLDRRTAELRATPAKEDST